MKVRASVKRMCKHCRTIWRHGVLMNICSNQATKTKHKQRQKGGRKRKG